MIGDICIACDHLPKRAQLQLCCSELRVVLADEITVSAPRSSSTVLPNTAGSDEDETGLPREFLAHV